MDKDIIIQHVKKRFPVAEAILIKDWGIQFYIEAFHCAKVGDEIKRFVYEYFDRNMNVFVTTYHIEKRTIFNKEEMLSIQRKVLRRIREKYVGLIFDAKFQNHRRTFKITSAHLEGQTIWINYKFKRGTPDIPLHGLALEISAFYGDNILFNDAVYPDGLYGIPGKKEIGTFHPFAARKRF
jgi:hypothetical protein